MKALLCAAGLAAVAARTISTKPELPIVDLGYEHHQAISFNVPSPLSPPATETSLTETQEDTGVYNFSNIRYAKPPTGSLRFKPPESPDPAADRLEDVQVCDQGRICPQAAPEWTLVASQFVEAFIKGDAQGFDSEAAEEKAKKEMAVSGLPAPKAGDDPYVTEDCLFLDVVVPSAVFRAGGAHEREPEAKGAPVLVYVHGGGYVFGNKHYGTSGDPGRLIATSQKAGDPGIVYVAIQYRLGALGWLAGSTLQAEGGVPNAGLLDQLLALEWVQKNIHLFGGDREEVTVMGQSAGGGSIVHHITSHGGWRSVPFQRAFIMSGGWVPITSDAQQISATNLFLDKLNATTVQEARDAASEEVILANALAVGAAPWTSFSYGPVVDGTYVPNHPSILLSNGDFHRGLDIMTGHVESETPSFTPSFVRTNTQFREFLHGLFPASEESAIDYMTDTLYPNPGINRTLESVADIGFTCNVDYIRKAFSGKTYNYKWMVPPALHASDLAYAFYNGPDPEDVDGGVTDTPLGPVQAQLAVTFQEYIVNFVKHGDPNGRGLPRFPRADEATSMLTFGTDGVGVAPDDTNNERCDWLQSVPFGGGCDWWFGC